MTNSSKVSQAVQPNTKMIWAETPSNPLLKITDLAEVSRVAHMAGAICVCDNTWASPIFQQPLALGADMVMHATPWGRTKYLGGNEDVLGGVVVAKEDSEF